jgi:integrase
MKIADYPRMPFPEAAEAWLASRKNICNGKHSTRFMYECYIKALTKFFGSRTLEKCADIDLIHNYQRDRHDGSIPGLHAAGASLVNHEINTLQQILARAGLWSRIADWYEPLRIASRGPGIALTPEEEACLFRTAARKKRWFIAYCCSLITATTTAGPGEIRNLRLGDIELDKAQFYITEGAKNENRKRLIPLNNDASWAMTELVKLAHKKGSTRPEHYLLPHRAHVKGAGWDPLKPLGSWRSAWEKLREEAGIFCPRLARLRMYDLRHHAITRLLENPNVSEGTVREICGHVPGKMLQQYSHVRIEAKRQALAAIEINQPIVAPAPPPSNDPDLAIAVNAKRLRPPVFRAPLLLPQGKITPEKGVDL